MSGGSVVVTSRSFATVDPAPERDLANAGFTVVRAGARHEPGELVRVLPEAVAWIAGTGPVTDDLLALAPEPDADRLARMRSGVTVVNTARADLVDEPAMAAALRDGTVGAFACDTLAAEHEQTASPLLAADLADQVLVTPHLGGQTDEAVARMGRMAADAVLAVLRGDRPAHPVNTPEALG